MRRDAERFVSNFSPLEFLRYRACDFDYAILNGLETLDEGDGMHS